MHFFYIENYGPIGQFNSYSIMTIFIEWCIIWPLVICALTWHLLIFYAPALTISILYAHIDHWYLVPSHSSLIFCPLTLTIDIWYPDIHH